MKRHYSIRTQLLKWLLMPMVLLLLIDSTVLYHYANKLMQDSLDVELLTTASEIDEILESNKSNEIHDLSLETKKNILQNTNDKTYYTILDASGKHLFGEIVLSNINQQSLLRSDPSFYYTEINKEKVRVALLPSIISINNSSIKIFIQVAETLNNRIELKERILIWILIPQLVLIITAAILLWFGIKRSLHSLLLIDNQLSQRDPHDLKPIQIQDIPREVNKLVNSLNELIFKLNHAMHSQNRFIADAAHQLRTPLAGISAQIELAEYSKDMPEIKQRLNKVSLSTGRLIHLVNQLLVLAKNQPEAAQLINDKQIDLVEFVKNILLEFESQADNKSINLVYEGLEEKIIIKGDSARLHDLIYNLIDNAILYTPDNGLVTAGVSIKENHPCLTVQDNGVGITKIEQINIFQRFYRGKDNLAFGTGLGLAIVKEIANLHNASIELQSTSVGERKEGESVGTTFTLTFQQKSV